MYAKQNKAKTPSGGATIRYVERQLPSAYAPRRVSKSGAHHDGDVSSHGYVHISQI